MLTPEELQAIRERADAAWAGPWRYVDLNGCIYGQSDIAIGGRYVAGECDDEADGEFIAHARTDIPAMLAHIAALEADNARLMNAYGSQFAENTRMRAVVEATAKEGWYMDEAQGCICVFPFCGGTGMAPSTIDHAADCPVTKARAILASASDNGTPA